MLFSSTLFIFYFLPVALAAYYLSGWRTAALLIASVAFYGWGEGAYVLLLAALIGVTYAGALWLTRATAGRGAILAALIVVDLTPLGYFKYSQFLAHSLNAVLPQAALPEITHALPLGISFFTFQLISYLADVYRGTVQVERGLARFSTYILMFPHLIAGPIVRYADIREEMHGDRRRTGHLSLGIQYFIVGLCQKVLIANTLAPVADHAFSLPFAALDGVAAWLGAGAYALQIYFDFCGYSNMAIGLAFMLGFTFPKNFDYPYAAQSMTEFWRRWHMSLSSWFRDYVYISLGGNRAGAWKTIRNLLVVFLLTGLWHGAAWTFVLWGLYHGAFLLLERFALGGVLAAAPKPLRSLYTLLVVVVGWVLFRADSLPHALNFLSAMFDITGFRTPDVMLLALLNPQVLAAFVLGVLLSFPLAPRLFDLVRTLRGAPTLGLGPDTRQVHALPTPLLGAGFVLSAALLVSSSLNPFLYFRF